MKNEVSGHWKKLVSDPKYLGAADLEGMPEIAGTIAATAKEMVQNASGKAEKSADTAAGYHREYRDWHAL